MVNATGASEAHQERRTLELPLGGSRVGSSAATAAAADPSETPPGERRVHQP